MLLAPAIAGLSCNPFAPALDTSASTNSVLGDQRTVDGVFENIRYSYTTRDTTVYGQLFDASYLFVYRDYDRGLDVTWGRDDELRTTSEMFRNVQRLDLVWNNIISLSADSAGTAVSVSRNFNLTVNFNPGDVVRVDGHATFAMARARADDPWMIVRWRDESNF